MRGADRGVLSATAGERQGNQKEAAQRKKSPEHCIGEIFGWETCIGISQALKEFLCRGNDHDDIGTLGKCKMYDP